MLDQDRNPRTPRKPKVYTIKTIDTRSHAFNVGIAKDFSPTMALWMAHLAHWTERNLANNKHLHDGFAWCYDTLDALCDSFPYYTRRQIETMINNSVNEGLVVRGNYNKTEYDRTCWYALTPKSYFYFQHLLTKKNLKRLFVSISQNCEMDFSEMCNQFPRNVTPIPDTDPDTDPYVAVGESRDSTTHTSLKELKKSKAEHAALTDEKIKVLFDEKFAGRSITLEELFNDCKEFHDQKDRWATRKYFMKWVTDEKIENYPKIESTLNTKPKVSKHNLDYQAYLSQFMNDRDYLKLPNVQGKEPMTFNEWMSYANVRSV